MFNYTSDFLRAASKYWKKGLGELYRSYSNSERIADMVVEKLK